jgi:hypothetical protein
VIPELVAGIDRNTHEPLTVTSDSFAEANFKVTPSTLVRAHAGTSKQMVWSWHEGTVSRRIWLFDGLENSQTKALAGCG